MRTKKIMQSLAVMLLLVLAGCKDTSQSYPVDLNSSLDTDRPSLQTDQKEQLSQMKTNQADCLLLYYPDTLQGLEEHCTYIVRGTVLDGSEQKTIQEDPQVFSLSSIQRRCSESMRYIRAICPKEVLFLSVRSIM